MTDLYFTISGCKHYYGTGFMEKGMKVQLVKEPNTKKQMVRQKMIHI